jgi:choline/glycine/proline betaine transport protein
MLRAPREGEVRTFITTQVHAALEQVAKELSARGRPTHIEEGENGATALRSQSEGVRDFVYGVAVASHPLAVLSPMAAGKPEMRFEARTYFSSGSRGYDIMGIERDQIIADVLGQFERYLKLVQSPDAQLVHGAPEHGGI